MSRGGCLWSGTLKLCCTGRTHGELGYQSGVGLRVRDRRPMCLPKKLRLAVSCKWRRGTVASRDAPGRAGMRRFGEGQSSKVTATTLAAGHNRRPAFELPLRCGDFERGSHRQFQNLAEHLQVFRARPGPAHLPEIHARGRNTNLRSDIGDRQTACQTSISEMLTQTSFTRQGKDSCCFPSLMFWDYSEDR